MFKIMDALFIYDHIFYRYHNNVYSSGAFTEDIWNRYLTHFTRVTVVSRGRHIDQIDKKLVLSSKDNVSFDLLYSVNGGGAYIKYSKSIRIKLVKLIRKHDIIIIRLPSAIGTLAAGVCKKYNIPYVVEVVGCVWDSNWNYGGILPKLIAPVNYVITKAIIKSCVSAIYVTKYFLQTRYPAKAFSINASNVEINTARQDTINTRINNCKNLKHFRIGIGGSFNVRYKGQKDLLKALLIAQESIPGFTVEMVGVGDYSWLENYSKKIGLDKKVKFLGRLPGTNSVIKWLESIDIYIHPSKQEGLPRMVVEAMSVGCPVLASSVAGIPELLTEKYLHIPGDYKKLSDDIIKYFNSPNSLVEMIKANYIKSQEYTSNVLNLRRQMFWEKTIKHYRTVNNKSKKNEK